MPEEVKKEETKKGPFGKLKDKIDFNQPCILLFIYDRAEAGAPFK